jgi:hypothetical protein
MEGETPGVARRALAFGPGCPAAANLGAHGAALVQPHAQTDGAIPLALAQAQSIDLTQFLSFEIGKFEVFEHDVDEFLEGDVRLVVVHPRLTAGLVPSGGTVPLRVADDLTRFDLAVPLPHSRAVLAKDEAVLADAADRHLDDAIPALADNGLLGDHVGDILADCLAHLLPVPQAIAGGAIAAFRVGGAERPEDGSWGHHAPRSGMDPPGKRGRSSNHLPPSGISSQSFHRLFDAYFNTTSTQLLQ